MFNAVCYILIGLVVLALTVMDFEFIKRPLEEIKSYWATKLSVAGIALLYYFLAYGIIYEMEQADDYPPLEAVVTLFGWAFGIWSACLGILILLYTRKGHEQGQAKKDKEVGNGAD